MPTLRLLPELEDSLRHIPGVRAASVVTGPDAVPTEVHVLAAPGKAPKQVVRDVQSLALARYDIDIDHRIVSVVQIGEDEPVVGVEEPTGTTRAVISGITVRTMGDQTQVTVQITSGEHQFEGQASGPTGPAHRPRVVADATVDALSELLGRSCQVESASVVRAGQREVALSVLTFTVPRVGEQVVTGTAVVRRDEADAVSRSVLNALNRQLAG